MSVTCWIIYNGFLPGDSFRDYAEMLKEAAIKRGHKATIYKNSELVSILDDPLAVLPLYRDALPDYVLYTDKDIYLAKQLELLQIPVFNTAETIEISDDKIKTYQRLAAEKISVPKTIFAPKTFGVKTPFTDTYLSFIIEQFSFPFIIKEAFGSFGEQVYLIHNVTQLKEKLAKIGDAPYMFQQFIETSIGVDVRLQVIGDTVVTAMKRTAVNDFRANVSSGGTMEPYEPTTVEKQLAVRASKAIGADFSGVDLLFGPNHQPIVCEVNSNAHIRNLLDCTGINVAHAIILHVEKTLEASYK